MLSLFLALCASALAFCTVALMLNAALCNRIRAEERMVKMTGEKPLPLSPKRLRAQRAPAIKISTVLIDQLASAGVPMRAEEFLLIWVLLAFIPAALSSLFDAHLLVTITLTGLGLSMPPLYVRHSRQKRLRAFEKQLNPAIISISNCLRSGLTFQQGMQNVAEQMPEPISREFARVLREMQLGSTSERALTNLARRVPSADVKLMVTAILISQQVGGNLSSVLENIAQTVQDRIKVKEEVHTITSTGRISGMVIGFLPIGLGVMLMLLNPDYMSMFFTTTEGRYMLLAAAALEAVGYLFIRKIVSVKY
jgi:tight adherence protein B